MKENFKIRIETIVRLRYLTSLILTCLLVVPVYSQPKSFAKEIKQAMNIHDTSTSVIGEVAALEAFGALTKKYPSEWQGFYWLAYLHTQIARMEGRVEDYSKDLPSKDLISTAMDLYQTSYKLKASMSDEERSDFLMLEGFITN